MRVFDINTYQFIRNITISNYVTGHYLRILKMFVYSTGDAKIYKCDEKIASCVSFSQTHTAQITLYFNYDESIMLSFDDQFHYKFWILQTWTIISEMTLSYKCLATTWSFKNSSTIFCYS
jgi:hypothetical protein